MIGWDSQMYNVFWQRMEGMDVEQAHRADSLVGAGLTSSRRLRSADTLSFQSLHSFITIPH